MAHYKKNRLETRVNICVSDETGAYLRARAEEEGTSVSFYVRNLVKKDEQAHKQQSDRPTTEGNHD